MLVAFLIGCIPTPQRVNIGIFFIQDTGFSLNAEILINQELSAKNNEEQVLSHSFLKT